MTILIADDDRALVLLLSRHLMKKGFDVVGAYDAMQASICAMRAPVAAAILDISMPAGTGYEVLKRMKANLKTSLIPVVVLSGSLDPEEEQKVTGLGAEAFLRKPVDFEKLDDTLKRLLG